MSAARRTAPPPPRDQHESAFTSTLVNLVRRVPGARAAALVDFDGETVDYAGRLDPFTRSSRPHTGGSCSTNGGDRRPRRPVALGASRGSSYPVNAFPEGYALALVLGRGAGFGGWPRAVASCARDLGREAGWSWRGAPPAAWFPADPATASRRRPVAMHCGGTERAVEVLGTVAGGLARRERGWRVRFDSGVEATLVREPGGLWYADEPPDGQRSWFAPPSWKGCQGRPACRRPRKKLVDRPTPPTIVRRPPRRTALPPVGKGLQLPPLPCG